MLSMKAFFGDKDALYEMALHYRNGTGRYAPNKIEEDKCLLSAADAGHKDASYELALHYKNGTGGYRRNEDNEKKYFVIAVEAGHPEALYLQAEIDLAMSKHYEAESKKNHLTSPVLNSSQKAIDRSKADQHKRKAMTLYQKAAEAGHREAQYLVAKNDFYMKNYKAAMRWALQSAAKGNKEAQSLVGDLYGHPYEGLTRDPAKSAEWHLIAAEGGTKEVVFKLIELYEQGFGGLDKNSAEAVKFYEDAAVKGNVKVQYILAQWYQDGHAGLAISDANAAVWYKKAAEQNHKEALLKLIECYERGLIGLSKRDSDAGKWYKKAVDHALKDALLKLIELYEQGLGGLSKTDSDALNWYKRAAENDHKGALEWVIDYYERNWDEKDIKGNENKVTLYIRAERYGYKPALFRLVDNMEKWSAQLYDKHKRAELYEKAANLGHSGAQYYLACAYDHGSRDYNKHEETAIKWYKKVAAQGHIPSINRMIRYYNWSLPEDNPEAINWYKLAARDLKQYGNTNILFALISFYENNQGGLSKYDEDALEWYIKAAEFENKEVLFRIIEFYEEGRHGLSPADQDALKWYKKAAMLKYKIAVFRIIKFYEDSSHELVKGEGEFFAWYQIAVDLGHEEAVFRLVEFYDKGRRQNTLTEYGKKVIENYTTAASRGSIIAEYALAEIYEHGYKEIEKNDIDAIKWYKVAAEHGHVEAQFIYARWNEEGRGGLTIDPNAALFWYEKSAEQGHTEAEYQAGRLHLSGMNGMAINIVKAKEWFLKAARKDHQYAKQALERLANVTSVAASASNGGAGQKTVSADTAHHIPSSEITIQDEIGNGAFGRVFRASWNKTTVAVKQLYPSPSADVVKKFTAEADITFKLRHPNIVQMYGISVDQKPFLMVMQLVPGGTLYEYLHRDAEVFDWKVLNTIIKGIASGVGYLHGQKVIYRDLKSANVLLENDKTPRLTDFGLAETKNKSSQSATRQGDSAAGTVLWMAPELFRRGGRHNEKTDVFSFGVVVWEVAARRLPFDKEDNQAMVPTWVKDGEREGIPEDCPDLVKQIIERCWDGNAEHRPEMEEVMEWMATGKVSAPRPDKNLAPALYTS